MKWRKYGCNVETAAAVLPSAKRTWLRCCTGHQILRAQQSAVRSLSRPTLKPLIALSTFLAELLMTPAGVSICWANTGGPCIPGPDARTTGRLGSDGQEAVPAPFPSRAPVLYRAGGPREQKGPLCFRGAFWQSAPRALRTFIWCSLERRGPNEITWAAMLRWLWKRSFSVLLLVPLCQISVEIQGSFFFFSLTWKQISDLASEARKDERAIFPAAEVACKVSRANSNQSHPGWGRSFSLKHGSKWEGLPCMDPADVLHSDLSKCASPSDFPFFF